MHASAEAFYGLVAVGLVLYVRYAEVSWPWKVAVVAAYGASWVAHVAAPGPVLVGIAIQALLLVYLVVHLGYDYALSR